MYSVRTERAPLYALPLCQALVIIELLRAERVPKQARLALSLLCSCLAATITIRRGLGDGPRDFGQVWFAARALVRGLDPYPLIGPGLTFDWGWPFVYPLTAAFVALPLAPFPESVASLLFVVLGTGLFAWTLMEHGYAPLFAFFSLPMQDAAGAGQWSPLLAATFSIPPLAVILCAKPTVGVAMFAARPTRFAVYGAVILTGLSLIVQPHWPIEQLDALARYRAQVAPELPFKQMVRYPGGALALLCCLRWRRPEARLIVVLACVPLTVSHYEMVPLLLVPRTFAESAVMVALGYAHYGFMHLLSPAPTWQLVDAAGLLFVATLLLPATLMVMRRPNTGPVPAWLDRRITAWPAWLRGQSSSRPM